ncbi:Sulfotransferase domain protein [Planctomycetes bacterium CA13]|uniref:Sulfotransferase domain protein n=1 Tax=Novipirellula herctigrandis TaxID=2527986 RepID=A0A5C5Z0N4_9BACT|nr:Sulfotransferase domain protein [Planctomycetes bacterium CA13]
MIYEPLDCQPVFLIGAARSGTKFLRDLIATDTNICEIPFDVNFVWRRGNEHYPHDGLPAEFATERVIRDLRKRLPRMANATNGKIMLEKTVSNALRIPFVLKVFPEARLIHLIRDGRSVVESVHRVWDEPTPLHYKLKKLRYFPVTNFRYAWWFLANSRNPTNRVWGPRYDGIDDDLSTLSRLDVCGHQWCHCVETALRDLKSVNEQNTLDVRYEDLISRSETIDSIVRFLEINDDEGIRHRFSNMVRRGQDDKWRGCWTNEQMEGLQKIIGPLLERLGYGAVSLDTEKHKTASSN